MNEPTLTKARDRLIVALDRNGIYLSLEIRDVERQAVERYKAALRHHLEALFMGEYSDDDDDDPSFDKGVHAALNIVNDDSVTG